MSNKPFICGNWKLNNNVNETIENLKSLAKKTKDISTIKIAVAPVVTTLYAAKEILHGTNIAICGQNLCQHNSGAYTGECSVQHLKEQNCGYCIIGHSERRKYFAESDEIVAKKAKTCADGGLVPIICVGEDKVQRESGLTKKILNKQLSPVLNSLQSIHLTELIIAYEPIWAIGTGLSADIDTVNQTHTEIIDIINKFNKDDKWQNIKIIYGGSVNETNAAGYIKSPYVDGLLVGGASIKADSFAQIITNINENPAK